MRKTAHMVEESLEKRGSISDSSVDTTKRKLNKAKTKTTSLTDRRKVKGRGNHPNSKVNLRPWKPGQSGNPGGKPKRDLASEIAQAIFENNPEMIYKAFGDTLKKGNPYSFDVLANRAFGKLKEKLEVTTEKELLDALMAGRKRALEKRKKNADAK